MRMRKGWDTQADNWVRFARTPGHDKYHELMNLPAFLDLLPAPGRRTLDLGCGEGRVSRALAAAGHTMVATDSSPVLAAAAATLPPAPAAVVSDVARLPFTDGSFDLVVAYMCLHDIDGMTDAIREAARVLQPGGRLAVLRGAAPLCPASTPGTGYHQPHSAPRLLQALSRGIANGVDPVTALQQIAFELERSLAPTYRVQAFRKAAWTIRELPDGQLATRISQGTLRDLPGIGKVTAAGIEEAAAGEQPHYLTRLLDEAPPPTGPSTATASRSTSTASTVRSGPTRRRWPAPAC